MANERILPTKVVVTNWGQTEAKILQLILGYINLDSPHA